MFLIYDGRSPSRKAKADAAPSQGSGDRRRVEGRTPPHAVEAVATVIRKQPLAKLPDPPGAVLFALDQPIGAPALSKLAAGRRSACLLICDITRPVPNGLCLRPMIEPLMAAGIARDKITVLVATGLHRPNLGEELGELVGDPWCWSMCGSRTMMRDGMRTMSISASRQRAEHPCGSTTSSPRPI